MLSSNRHTKPLCITVFSNHQSKRCSYLRQGKRISLTTFLKVSSSICALIGGLLLALKLPISSYGFVFLAISSSQLLVASLRAKDSVMIFYAGSLFLFVDCVGVYRWLLA